MFMERFERLGPCGGLTEFMMGSVELGLMETMFDLARRPRNEAKTIVCTALDIVHFLISLDYSDGRRYLLTRAAACDGLNKCLEVSVVRECILVSHLEIVLLQIMETHELCLDRYAAARAIQALAVELTWAPLLKSTEAAEVIVRLMRHVVQEVNSYSEQLRSPDKIWQLKKMIERNIVC